jgi:ATP-binding cassette, subfamily C, bacterial CydD
MRNNNPAALQPVRDLITQDVRIPVILLVLAPLYVVVTRLAVPYFGAKLVDMARGSPVLVIKWWQNPLLGISVMLLIGWLLDLGMTHLRGAVRVNASDTLRRRMFERLLPAFRRDLRPAAVGDAITRMQRAPDALWHLQDAAYGVYLPLLYLVVVTVVFLWRVPPVGGVMLGLLIAVGSGIAAAAWGCGQRCYNAERAHDNLQERASQSLAALLLTYVTGTEARAIAAHAADVTAHSQAARRCRVCHRDIATVLRFIIAVAVLGGLALVARAVARQHLSPTLGVASTIILLRLTGPLQTVVGQAGDLLESAQQLQGTLAGFEHEVSSAATMLTDAITPLPTLSGEVAATHLKIHVACGSTGVRRDADGSAGQADMAAPAIINVPDFVVGAGRLVLVTGPIGSGKSCLLRALVGLHPYDGKLAFGLASQGGGWREVRDVPSSQLPAWATYVPQTPVLVSGSVRDNLTLGNDTLTLGDDTLTLGDDNSPPASNNTTTGGTTHDARVLALGLPLPPLDQDVGRNGDGLSGGQRLVVALARALLSPARIIAVDEPTSALHGELRDVVLRRLVDAALRDGRTIFVSSHHGLEQWRRAAGQRLVEITLGH